MAETVPDEIQTHDSGEKMPEWLMAHILSFENAKTKSAGDPVFNTQLALQGKHLGNGFEHEVREYGPTSVAKYQRLAERPDKNWLSADDLRQSYDRLSGINSATGEKRREDDPEYYFGDYMVDTDIYDNGHGRYVMVQPKLAFTNLTPADLQDADIKRQLLDIAKINGRYIRATGRSLAFFGKDGMASIGNKLLPGGKNNDVVMSNIVVVNTTEGKRLKIIDFGELVLSANTTDSASLAQIAKDRASFHTNDGFAKRYFGINIAL